VWSTSVATFSILNELQVPEGGNGPTGLPWRFDHPAYSGMRVDEASAAMHRQVGMRSGDFAEKDIPCLRRGHPLKEARQLGFELTPVWPSQAVIPPDLPRLDLKDGDHKADAIKADGRVAPLRSERAPDQRARPLNDLPARHQG
jgi:hypothetical protein